MPLVINATPASPTANSYATLAEANTYHESIIPAQATDWTSATDATKEAALVTATRLLDQWFLWESWPSTEAQNLDWPRQGLLGRNGRQYIGDMVIPIELKNATAELARQMIVENRTLDSDIEVKNITSLRAGPVSLSFGSGVTAKVLPDAVMSYIPEWWGRPRSTRTMTRDLMRA